MCITTSRGCWLIITFLLLSNFASAQALPDVRLLELDRPIERELKGGEAHAYSIGLTTGQFLHVIVDHPALLDRERTLRQRLNAAAERQTRLLSDKHTVAGNITPSPFPSRNVTPQPTPKIPDTPAPQFPPTQIASITLLPVATRDVSEDNTLVLDPAARIVRLRLVFRKNNYRSYSAKLTTLDDQLVWQTRGLKADSGKSVTLQLAPGLLQRQDYLLTLNGRTAGGQLETISTYYFHVVRH